MGAINWKLNDVILNTAMFSKPHLVLHHRLKQNENDISDEQGGAKWSKSEKQKTMRSAQSTSIYSTAIFVLEIDQYMLTMYKKAILGLVLPDF